MIHDTIDNLKLYTSHHPGIADVIAYIEGHDMVAHEDGKFDINDRGDFVLVEEYEPLDPADVVVEAHRRFYDVQTLFAGEELIGYRPTRECTAPVEYDADADFQKLEGDMDMIPLRSGSFMIFYPDDAHKPSVRADDGGSKVKKAVFKIQL